VITFELEGFDELLDGFADAADAAAEAAVERAAELTAEEARQNHPYTDRTGDLTDSLGTYPAQGKFRDGNLSAAAIAGTHYAKYVNAHPDYEFLGPAWERVESRAGAEAERVLEAAFKGRGF
jgi:hypothetical protein